MNEFKQQRGERHGMTFPWYLTLLFIVLKLTGYITWNWMWVISPIWISAMIVAFVQMLIDRQKKVHNK